MPRFPYVLHREHFTCKVQSTRLPSRCKHALKRDELLFGKVVNAYSHKTVPGGECV